MIRVLIVDDEPLARRGLRVRLEREPDVEIVGEAGDGPAACTAILDLKPDLVYLDVHMPGLDGFRVLEEVSSDHLPMVVFVTAHDVHALKAFEIHALDYLLKPYTESRFQESLRRAREALSRSGALAERERISDLLLALEASRSGLAAAGRETYPARFSVRDRDRILLVRAESLEAVVAAGNYVELVADGRKLLLRETLSEMERKLDPARFARIHRSAIINTDRVREIVPDPHGDCDVVMEGGQVYRLSRAYRSRLLPEGT